MMLAAMAGAFIAFGAVFAAETELGHGAHSALHGSTLLWYQQAMASWCRMPHVTYGYL